jgi:hypothetical protein
MALGRFIRNRARLLIAGSSNARLMRGSNHLGPHKQELEQQTVFLESSEVGGSIHNSQFLIQRWNVLHHALTVHFSRSAGMTLPSSQMLVDSLVSISSFACRLYEQRCHLTAQCSRMAYLPPHHEHSGKALLAFPSAASSLKPPTLCDALPARCRQPAIGGSSSLHR